MGDMTEPPTHVGTSGQPHPLTRCRLPWCGQNPPTGTWGAPVFESGRDDFTGKQQPNPDPVDDLSRFVLYQIRLAETEPVADGVVKNYNQPMGAMAHRYAGNMRRDMVAFRRIVAIYCDIVNMGEPFELAAAIATAEDAVKAIAMRFDTHPDFKPEWRLE